MHQVNSQVSDTGEMNKQLTKEVPLEDQVRADRQKAASDWWILPIPRKEREKSYREKESVPTNKKLKIGLWMCDGWDWELEI